MDSIKEILKKPKTRKIFEEMANLNIKDKNIGKKINNVSLKLYSLIKDIINTLPNLSEKQINESIEKILINKELDKKTKNKLRFYINNLFNNSNSKKGGDPTDEEDNNCPICLDPLNNMPIKTCFSRQKRHKFHSECIEGWMNTGKNTCPICRGPLDFRSYFRRTIDFLTPRVNIQEVDEDEDEDEDEAQQRYDRQDYRNMTYIRNLLFLILLIITAVNMIMDNYIYNNRPHRILPQYIIVTSFYSLIGRIYNDNAGQIRLVIIFYIYLVTSETYYVFHDPEFIQQQNIITATANNNRVLASPYLEQHRDLLTQYNDPNLQTDIDTLNQALQNLYNSIGIRGGKKTNKRKTKKRNINKRKKINKKSKTLRK
jgi:hypothetical protein